MAKTDEFTSSEGIKCPHCGRLHGINTVGVVVTYCGTNSPGRMVCRSCDEEFWVQEVVTRVWEVTVF